MEKAKRLAAVIEARRDLRIGEMPMYRVVAVLDTVLYILEQQLKEQVSIKDCGEIVRH